MPRPTTKATLLAASGAGLDRLLAAIDGLPSEVREADFSVPGLFTKARDSAHSDEELFTKASSGRAHVHL